jgi:hypothetical protein
MLLSPANEVNMSAASQRNQVTVRPDPELLAKISQAAAEDRRPVSQYVRNLIADALDADRARQQQEAR